MPLGRQMRFRLQAQQSTRILSFGDWLGQGEGIKVTDKSLKNGILVWELGWVKFTARTPCRRCMAWLKRYETLAMECFYQR
jgi:hypothetical protein